MNLQCIHILYFFIMLCNINFNHWVIWSGTLEIINYFKININMFWGLYNINIQSSTLFQNTILSFTIPDFLEFMNNEFGLQIIKENTLPMYYSVYIAYICILFYEFYSSIIAIIYFYNDYNIQFIYKFNILYKMLIRSIFSAFILLSLFNSYNTHELCLDNYIINYNSTQFDVITVLPQTEYCSYSWTLLSIIINEFICFLHLIYVYFITYYQTQRKRTNSDYIHLNSMDNINSHFNIHGVDFENEQLLEENQTIIHPISINDSNNFYPPHSIQQKYNKQITNNIIHSKSRNRLI